MTYFLFLQLSTDDQKAPGDQAEEETDSSSEYWTSSEEDEEEEVKEQEQKLQHPSKLPPPAPESHYSSNGDPHLQETSSSGKPDDLQIYKSEPGSRPVHVNEEQSTMSPLMLRAMQTSPSVDSNRSQSPADSGGHQKRFEHEGHWRGPESIQKKPEGCS